MKYRAMAQINLDAAAVNMQNIRKITNPNSQIMAVVKSDAYGHGALELSKVFLENGADRLAVAIVDEAVQIRKEGIKAPIMVLGATSEDEVKSCVEYDIIPTVFDYDCAKCFSDTAMQAGKTVRIHIKLDTGMSRIGFVVSDNNNEVVSEIMKIAQLPNIEIEGIYTHFSTADEEDRSYTELQFERFINVCDELKENGLDIPVKHVCNSAGIMMYPHMHLDMVRPGIIYSFIAMLSICRISSG